MPDLSQTSADALAVRWAVLARNLLAELLRLPEAAEKECSEAWAAVNDRREAMTVDRLREIQELVNGGWDVDAREVAFLLAELDAARKERDEALRVQAREQALHDSWRWKADAAEAEAERYREALQEILTRFATSTSVAAVARAALQEGEKEK